MKLTWKKGISFLLAGSMLAALLSGCSGKKSSATETSASADAKNPTAIVNDAGQTVTITEPTAADSYDVIYNAFSSVQKTAGEVFDASQQESGSSAQLVNPDASAYGDPDYSKAAIPADGVSTGDLVITDGTYLYMVCGSELVIVSAAGAATAETGRTFLTTQSPAGYSGGETVQKIFLSGNNLFAVTYEILYQNGQTSGSTQNGTASEKVHVKQFDVSNPAKPAIVSDYAQSGRYLNAYLSGGVLYVIGAYSVWSPDQSNPASFVPSITKNGEDKLLDAGSILICPGLDSTDYTIVSAIDASSGECRKTEALTGYNAWSAADGESLYLGRTSYTYTTSDPHTEDQYSVTDYTYNAYTRLLRLKMDGSLDLAASGTVEGYLYNQGAMSLTEGTLYLATVCNGYAYQIYTDSKYGFVNYKVGDKTATNAVYAMNGDLTVARTLRDTAAGQSVYDIRFTGSTAYVMDYENLIPKYAIDMTASTLKAQKLSGLTSITQNLFYFGTAKTAGVGVLTDGSGNVQGLQAAVYTTAGTEFKLLDSTLVTDKWNQAMKTPAAIQVLAELQTIAVPTDTGYLLYSLQNNSLTALGQVQLGYVSAGTRVLQVGNNWYFCNDAVVVAASGTDLSQLAKVEFVYG